MAPPRVLFSCAEESFVWAAQELSATFGARAKVVKLAADLGAVAGVALADVADACEQRRIFFIRHVTRELAAPGELRATLPAIAGRVLESLQAEPAAGGLALQTWASGPNQLGFAPADVFAATRDALAAAGYEVARAERPHVVSCCLFGTSLSLGRNELERSLSDWPGGRTRLARPAEQISRSEFKLEELFKLRPLAAQTQRALDLGASPGGWTRVLRGLGFSVCAVDPGDLHARLTADPQVCHVRMTASAFLEQTHEPFDLVANDMRMDPIESCRIMLNVARLLRAGATMIVTLKLGNADPVPTIRECLRMLGTVYDVSLARQLHHNRLEITVLGRLPAT
jgi:23S rRNA (cytidine2498-2'-O)-methyltransferase